MRDLPDQQQSTAIPIGYTHACIPRRTALQAGSIGLLGLGLNHVAGLRALAAETGSAVPKAGRKAVIYIFLSGGLTQHDSFDPKPEAPDTVRGEFAPIATRTPGVHICEHLPKLAACSDKWALVRSLTHPHNDHTISHHVMLTGRCERPSGFNEGAPTANDFPSIASVVNGIVPSRNNLPPAAVLPEKLVHVTGRTIPGQFAGQMGWKLDPWFIEASHFKDTKYIHGAFPEYGFQRWEGPTNPPNYLFEAPRLELPQGVLQGRFENRLQLLQSLDQQRRNLDTAVRMVEFDRLRQSAVSLLNDGGVHRALDVHSAPAELQDRYGRNSFGLSWAAPMPGRSWRPCFPAFARRRWGRLPCDPKLRSPFHLSRRHRRRRPTVRLPSGLALASSRLHRGR